MRYNTEHLEKSRKAAIQCDEALFLYALVKVLCPKVIVEFGFCQGYSSINFLKAMSEDCKLYSFDPSEMSANCAKNISDERFRFYKKKAEYLQHTDIDFQFIDILFIDASHLFNDTKRMFENVINFLGDSAIIIVHDTGLFNKDFMGSEWKIEGSYYVNEKGYAHRPQERIFVNFIKKKYSEYQQIHLHTLNVGRMGMTVLQKYSKLIVRKKTINDYKREINDYKKEILLKWKSRVPFFIKSIYRKLKK